MDFGVFLHDCFIQLAAHLQITKDSNVSMP